MANDCEHEVDTLEVTRTTLLFDLDDAPGIPYSLEPQLPQEEDLILDAEDVAAELMPDGPCLPPPPRARSQPRAAANSSVPPEPRSLEPRSLEPRSLEPRSLEPRSAAARSQPVAAIPLPVSARSQPPSARPQPSAAQTPVPQLASVRPLPVGARSSSVPPRAPRLSRPAPAEPSVPPAANGAAESKGELAAAQAEIERLQRHMRARDAYLSEIERALDASTRQLEAAGLRDVDDAVRLLGRVRGQAFRIAELESELRQAQTVAPKAKKTSEATRTRTRTRARSDERPARARGSAS